MAEPPVDTFEPTETPEWRARKRLENYYGMLWHAAAFVIVNSMLWFLDFLDGGLDWAFWVTGFWGVGLAFHVAAYLIGDDNSTNPRYQRYLEEERQRNPYV